MQLPRLLLAASLACSPVAPPTPQVPPTPTTAEVPAPTETLGTVKAAYVLWTSSVSGPRALARAVLDGNTCPTLTVAGATKTMAMRDNPHGFSVIVCEAYVPNGQAATVQGWSTPLPAPSDTPTNPVIFGDTGCKHSDCASGSAAEPFATLASEAASRKPDLVLHAGDFNYRGTGGFSYEGNPEYDAGDVPEGEPSSCQLNAPYVSQNATYSASKDHFETWHDDLFKAAAPLMAAAPWVVARGNHELCSRAGPGWFYFLDPNTNLDGGAQLSCPSQQKADGSVPMAADGYTVLPEPLVLQFTNLRLVVIDSANACDEYAPGKTTAIYTTQLVSALTPASTPTWVLSHRPTWGVQGTESVSVTLQSALAASGATLPDLFVAGHMHQFQSVAFGGARPAQLVVGNSGVKLGTANPDGDFSSTVDGLPAKGLAFAHHGFLHVTSMTGKSWTGNVVDRHNAVIATCDAGQPGGHLCQMVP